jgi:hypothetical protein
VLYFPTELCGALGVAISRDEGASWQFRPIAGSGLEDIYTSGTTVDSHGNLYFAWRGPGALPYLSTSTDHGATWNPPLMVAPPGVREVRRVAVAVRKRGEVALSYLGTADGAHFNGYITESHNVFTGRPRFWSASVNDCAGWHRLGRLPLRQDQRLPWPADRGRRPTDQVVVTPGGQCPPVVKMIIRLASGYTWDAHAAGKRGNV